MKFLLVLMLALSSLARAQDVSSAGTIYSGGAILSTTPAGNSGDIDPALLNLDTTVANTPAPGDNVCVGTLFNVSALTGGCAFSYTLAQFQIALNAGACGQHIIMQNAAIPGAYTLPSGLVCAPGNWLIIEHDITDPVFPAEGTRIDPCYHGMKQNVIPYYPFPTIDSNPNNCGRHVPMIKIVASTNGNGISIKTPNSGPGTPSVALIRFIGIEITRDQTSDSLGTLVNLTFQPGQQNNPVPGQDCALTGTGNSALAVDPADCMNDQPTFIIFDRCILHGDAQRQTVRAFNFGGARWVAVIDSYIYDINVTFGGGQGDAQAYFWGTGHGLTNVGFGKFSNNFVSASTMANLFCGTGFVEPLSPVTGFDGIPHDCHYVHEWYYKNLLWNAQRGQTLGTTDTIEGMVYPPLPDQELTVSPTSIQLQTGQTYQFNTTWLYDSLGGLNRILANGTDCTKGNTVCVDGVLNGNSVVGIITKNGEHTVPPGPTTAPFASQNQVTYTYTSCTGVGVPIAACNGVTSTGTHSIVFSAATVENRSTNHGANRILSATATVTLAATAPAQQIAVSPAAPDLQIQPSYKDACVNPGDPCNVRQFCLTMFAGANFTTTSMAWKVDGITNGDATHGQMCSMSSAPCVAPGPNDQQAAYCSAPAPGQHTISVSSANGTSGSSLITVSSTAPIVGYDLKTDTVKNVFEFKCINGALVEKSLFENAWGSNGTGGGQGGAFFLAQVINQGSQVLDGIGANVGHGPQYIRNVTLSYDKGEHLGNGFILVGHPNFPGGLGLSFFKGSNLVLDDVNDLHWGNAFSAITNPIRIAGDTNTTTTDSQWTTAANPETLNVALDHVTIVGHSTSGFSISNNLAQKPLVNVSITNSIIGSQGSKTFVNATGEANDCDSATGTGTANNEVAAWQLCSTPFAFHHIALLDNTADISGPNWPDAATLWKTPSTAADLFAGYNGVSDDLRVCTGFHIPTATCTAGTYAAGGAHQASDGQALGGDVVGVNLEEATVRYGAPNPPPTVDLQDWALMPLPTRASNHIHGSLGGGSDTFSILDSDSIYPVGYPKGIFFWAKHPTGNPWDIEKYSATSAADHWITEDGDSVDAATCVANGFSSCFLDPNAYKRFLTPVKMLPRNFTYGSTVTIDTPGPNTFVRTTNCELPGTSTNVNLGDVRSVTTGPFNMTWGGSIDHGAGGGVVDNVNGVPTIENDYFYGGTIASGSFNDKESTFYVQGFGRVAWFFYQKVSGTYVLQQHTISNVLTSGSTPPNFPCGAGQTWWQ